MMSNNSMKSTIGSGKISANSGKAHAGSGKLLVSPGKMSVSSRKMPMGSGKAPVGSGKMSADSGKAPTGSWILPVSPKNSAVKKVISCLLVLALAAGIGLLPTGFVDQAQVQAAAPATTWTPVTQQPALVVTGTGILGGDYPAEDLTAAIANERSYTMEDLVAMEAAEYFLYSFRNAAGSDRVYKAKGVTLESLFVNTAFTSDKYTDFTVKAIEPPQTYVVTFDPDYAGALSGPDSVGFYIPRYYFPEATGIQVPVIVATKSHNYGNNNLGIPTDAEVDERSLEVPLLIAGQLTEGQVNSPLFNDATRMILVGDELPAVLPVTFTGDGASGSGGTGGGAEDTVTYTRAELLLMPRYETLYTGTGISSSPYARGVPLMTLLGDGDWDTAEFTIADGANRLISKEDIFSSEREYILAYENRAADATDLRGIYRTSGATVTYFSLYSQGGPTVNYVTGVRLLKGDGGPESEYKHIAYDGAPYNLDAITGATLTVEGPGVRNSVPITVRQLEETGSGNIRRGDYSDSLGARTYEGVRLLSILDGAVHSNVQRLDDDVNVVFRNRWRHEIGRMSYGEIKNAESNNAPVILAYGFSNTDGSNISPFVYDGGAGHSTALGNGDGPMRVVYDRAMTLTSPNSVMPTSGAFPSIAYLYIEEGVPPPGFKHITATDPVFRSPENTEHIITLTGSALGREINFTTRQLQELVTYGADGKPAPGGLGYRDEYSLSNTTYWYVNEYEGVNLWELLVHSGLDRDKYKDDDKTLVSFSAWDNYQISAQFSTQQLANPDLFYFYEKSPLDVGTDRPTKAQLSDPAYHPTNRQDGEGWILDDNGYPIKKGYPVLLAYGVNGYPYVRDGSMPGFRSGLGNHGGPMRVIYGKTDGLNRSNPGALENYAYFFNNGSEQLQKVQEVFVGDDKRFSTHRDNPLPVYQAMADEPDALTVEIVVEEGVAPQIHRFTLAELEEIIYGVDKRVRDNENRQEKGYYFTRTAGGGHIQELFEGVNLEYLLFEHIGLPGRLGSVELYSAGATTAATRYSLSEIGEKGSNFANGLSGNLGMAVVYAKNGYPLVREGSSASPPESGYVHNDPINSSIGIRNNGGPLLFVRGQTDEEVASSSPGGGVIGTDFMVERLEKIVVNLEPDKFAHVGQENEAYAAREIQFSGAVAREGKITVGALETLQRYIVTDAYTVGGATRTYRGLDLLGLLNDRLIGASSLMSEVTIKNGAGNSVTLTRAELAAAITAKKPVILAYGASVGGPPDYAGAASLKTVDGGPMRLISDSGSGAGGTGGGSGVVVDIADVTEIVVSADTLDRWTHSFSPYSQYADYTVEISGQNLKHNRTYTVTAFEAMDSLIAVDEYRIGSQPAQWFQGVDLYRLLDTDIGFAEGLSTSSITVTAADGYSINFDGSQLANGINGKPILLAFGRGLSADNGLPLVPTDKDPGYDDIYGNNGGPIRFLVHDNSGWAIQMVKSIVVGAAGGLPDPNDSADFTVFGLPGGDVDYSIDDLKSMEVKTASYTQRGTAESATGVMLYDLLRSSGVSDSAIVTVNTTDGFENGSSANAATYRDIPMSVIKDQEYMAAFTVDGAPVSDAERDRPDVIATVRVYRRYDDGATTWLNRLTNILGVTVTDYSFISYQTGQNGFPMAGVRSISIDGGGGGSSGTGSSGGGTGSSGGAMWVGTYGGGIARLANGASEFDVFNTTSAPALQNNYASGLAVDASGGVWFSQNASFESGGGDYGVGYMKDGVITWYRAPGTVPHDYVQAIEIDAAGNVWFGSYGGLTRYNPVTGVWRTWTTTDGLPASSVNTIVFDGEGGVWAGCYPDTPGKVDIPGYGEADAFRGGYAYLNAAGEISFSQVYDYRNETGAGLQPWLMADFWVRGMAVDRDGGVWVVRSSSFMPHVGGRVDYVSPDKQSVTTWTGHELLGAAALTGTQEIRMVAVDKNGGLWFGTSGAGLFHCTADEAGGSGSGSGSSPGSAPGSSQGSGSSTVAAPSNIYRIYSTDTGAWPSGTPMDNIQYLRFIGDALYVGSNGGVAWAEVELAQPPVLLFQIVDNRSGANGRVYDVTETIAQEATEDIAYNYTAVNTFGTPSRQTDARGPILTELFDNLGITMSGSDSVQFLAYDNFSQTVLWEYLAAERYFFPNLSASLEFGQAPPDAYAGAVPAPAIIALNSGNGRLMIGQRAPHEQTNNMFVRNMLYDEASGRSGQIILTDGDNSSFPAVTNATPPSGSTIGDGVQVTFNDWETLLGFSDGFIYFTTDGSEPTHSAALYNYQTNSGASGAVFNPVIRAGDVDPNTGVVTVKVKVLGRGKLAGPTTDLIYYLEGWGSGKEQQAPPDGLSGQRPASENGMGRILGTTTAMEFSEDGLAWFDCTDGYTEVVPGQYHVRFKETLTHNAGEAARITVLRYPGSESGGGNPPPRPENGILAVYNGDTMLKEFTQAEIDGMGKLSATYSALNTWPSYRTYAADNAVSLLALLNSAGAPLSDGRTITFYATDGFYTTLRLGDLTAPRYFFSENGSRGGALSAVLNFQSDGARLLFGQLAAQEQISQAFVEKIDRIAIGGTADSWRAPTASPASGATVKQGDPIRLSIPSGSGEPKVYYTLNGSSPTVESSMYNVTAERWLSQQGMTENEPIRAPGDGEFTITARVIGLGRQNSTEVRFTYNRGKEDTSSSSGGSGVTSGSAPDSASAPQVVVEVNAEALGNTPVVSFSAEDLHAKIAEAVSEGKSGRLELRVSALDTVTSVSVEITAESLKEMIDAGLKSLIISNPLGMITYDLAALQSIYAQGEGDVFTFRISRVDPQTLDEALRASVLSGWDLYQIQVLCDGEQITDFGQGHVTARLNFSLLAGQSPFGVIVRSLEANGSGWEIESAYNVPLGYVEFELSANSYYMVGYDDQAAVWTGNPFTDVSSGDWFYDYVRFAYTNGLMLGTAEDEFSPNEALSRAMIVTVLYRLAGSPDVSPGGGGGPNANASDNPFFDVSEGAWYEAPVMWAAANGIVTGFGDGRFGPDDDTTREQLAVILLNYQRIMGKTLPDVLAVPEFSDRDQISEWALDAVERLTAQGVIIGKPGNLFDPQSSATRAEFATMLQRFIAATTA